MDAPPIAHYGKIDRYQTQQMYVPDRRKLQSLALSFPQQQLWLKQANPSRSDDRLCIAIKLTGNLNLVALQQSLDEIVTHHEVLRTNIISIEGDPFQVVRSPRSVELSYFDLQSYPQPQRDIEIERQLQQECQRTFDLERDLMLRGSILQIGCQEYILLSILHPIAADRRSMAILTAQLAEFYTANCDDRSPNVPALPIQYADFAQWQRQWLQGEFLASMLAFWNQQLASTPTVLSLPTDLPRLAVPTFRSSTRSVPLPGALTSALSELSQQAEIQMSMTLLAAFYVLLYRYTGSTDIVVGTSVNGRKWRELTDAIGLFTNTLLLRTDLSGNPSFLELLKRVKKVVTGAYNHQDLPFQLLLEKLQPKQDGSNPPPFQVMFRCEEDGTAQQKIELAHLVTIPYPLDLNRAECDLTLEIELQAHGYEGRWLYNPDLFSPPTIDRFTGHFQTLLAGIIADPTQPISQLPLLTPDERQQILWEWNDTQTDYPQDLCIHQLVEAQVKLTPTAVAVVFEAEQLTYQELNLRANQLANYLQKRGVAADVPVGICLERSLKMVVGLLGILKAGGAYVPLDSTYPQDRLAYMLENSQVKVLISSQELAAALPTSGIEVICLDTDWEQIDRESSENLGSQVGLENLGYTIYTSGSTGLPKGVAMTQRALCNLILWQVGQPIANSQAKTLQFAPISFDVSFQEIFGTWCAGGTLVLMVDELRRDPCALLKLLIKAQIDRLFLPFVALQQLAEVAVNHQLFPQQLSEVITAGEQLQITPAIRKFFGTLANCSLHNHYGPSESHVVTTFTLSNSVQNWSALPPIGRPIANTQMYVLDSQMQPVPIGVAGELYIGGDCLARGYFQRPDLTDQRFIPNPLSAQPDRDRANNPLGERGARLYKTGDLVRYLHDGNIEYLGRIDNQVKIRGFRIELGEIESLLSQHPAIVQTTVIVREDSPGDKRLVAYCVTNSAAQQLHQDNLSSQIDELRSFIAQKVPNYMVPAFFVLLPALPMTPSGKVDRRALPMPDYIRQDSAATFVAPQDEIELKLTQIWQQVLGVKSIGIQDNFFDLGGHSLLAVYLFDEIEKVWNQTLPLATLFQSPTIETLANILRQEGYTPTWSSLVLIQAGIAPKPPLFCIHPVGGNILEYYPLVNYLDRDRSIYGLQSQGLDGLKSPLERVEDMANQYIQEMLTVEPEGPYLLLGYSFGGAIAFEIAQQLQAGGKQVAFLGLLDLSAPTIGNARPSLWKSIQIHLNNLWQLNTKERWIYITDRLDYRFNNVNYKDFVIRGLSEIAPPSSQLLNLIDANLQAESDYIPQVYAGDVHLFRCQVQSVSQSLCSDLGWGNLIEGQLEVYNIPSTHYGILKEPSVRLVAEKLKLCLERMARS